MEYMNNIEVIVENVKYILENYAIPAYVTMAVVSGYIAVRIFKRILAFIVTTAVIAFMYYSRVGF